MEEHRQQGEEPGPSIFLSRALELISRDFATNLSYYRNYPPDDPIAELILGFALDLVDRTSYAHFKSEERGRKEITVSMMENFPGDAVGSNILQDLFDPGLVDEIMSQNRLLLEILRERYRSLVRGPFGECWREANRSLDLGSDTCLARKECLSRRLDGDGPGGDSACETFYSAWRSTVLALGGREELRHDGPALAGEVRRLCRVLQLLTEPDRLEKYLADDYWRENGSERRTVRGVAVRLLTMLVDHCLEDLNRRMGLPSGESFGLVQSCR